MCKREGIFLSVMLLWFIFILVKIFIFPTFAVKFGNSISIIPISVLLIAIIPRYFSNKYNNWLESDLFKKK